MRPPPRRSAAPRLRTGETRIGRLLLPGLVLVFATYVTFQLCQGVAAQAFAAARSAAAAGAAGATPFRRDDLGSQATLGGGVVSTRTAPALAAASDDRGTIHVMATSNGSPYLNYQTRIMYKTFTMARAGATRPAARAAPRPGARCCAAAHCSSELRRGRFDAAARAALRGPARGVAACRCRRATRPSPARRTVDPPRRRSQVQQTPEGKHMKYFTRCVPAIPAPAVANARAPFLLTSACVCCVLGCCTAARTTS